MEDIERPSFENFLSKPGNLTDHLEWQLGSIPISPEVREASATIIGNLNEDGYLIASDEEMLGVAPPSSPEADAAMARQCGEGRRRPCVWDELKKKQSNEIRPPEIVPQETSKRLEPICSG